MLTKEQILRYLRQVADELETRGLRGEILLTGGAAMCLVHEARDITKDIDALYEPKETINRIARDIAAREGLPEDWLNDSVKGFIEPNAPAEDFVSFGSLRVQTVSAEYLLAMKMMSARYGEKDSGDILFLFNKLGIKTAEAATDVLLKFYPVNRILPKTQYIIEEMIEQRKERTAPTAETPNPPLLDQAEDAGRIAAERKDAEQCVRGIPADSTPPGKRHTR
ncbi:MAG: hypothetical protein LBQ15_11705 [Clostridium sp.]|jgi:hypothetical protein|nr:hypothetical protein [Clostridium sp.]